MRRRPPLVGGLGLDAGRGIGCGGSGITAFGTCGPLGSLGLCHGRSCEPGREVGGLDGGRGLGAGAGGLEMLGGENEGREKLILEDELPPPPRRLERRGGLGTGVKGEWSDGKEIGMKGPSIDIGAMVVWFL